MVNRSVGLCLLDKKSFGFRVSWYGAELKTFRVHCVYGVRIEGIQLDKSEVRIHS